MEKVKKERVKCPVGWLAKEGMLFTCAHSAASVSRLTGYGVLTGRYFDSPAKSTIARLLAPLPRRKAGLVFKETAEILFALETRLISSLLDGQGAVGK